MWKVYYENVNAHDSGIVSCDWGRIDFKSGYREKSKAKKNKDAQHIVTVSTDDTVKVWDHKNYDDPPLKLKQFKNNGPFGITAVAFNSDASEFVTCSYERIHFWRTADCKEKKMIKMEFLENLVVTYAPNDKYIACAGNSGNIHMFEGTSGKLVQSYTCIGLSCPNHVEPTERTLKFRDKINCIKFDKRSRVLGICTDKGSLIMFDITTGVLVCHFQKSEFRFQTFCFPSDLKFVLIGTDSGHMIFYTYEARDAVLSKQRHNSLILCSETADTSNIYVSGGADTKVKIWDLRNRDCLDTMHCHKEKVRDIKFNSTEDRMVSVSDDKSMVLYSINQ